MPLHIISRLVFFNTFEVYISKNVQIKSHEINSTSKTHLFSYNIIKVEKVKGLSYSIRLSSYDN